MSTQNPALDHIKKNWHLIPPNFRCVFSYIQYISQNYFNVFPSIPTIAKNSGCSESTVKRAMNYFRSFGWLVSIKRPYQSNLYKMDQDLIHFDCNDHKNFQVNDSKKQPSHSENSCETESEPVLENLSVLYNNNNCEPERPQSVCSSSNEQFSLDLGVCSVAALVPEELRVESVIRSIKQFSREQIADAVSAFKQARKTISNIHGWFVAAVRGGYKANENHFPPEKLDRVRQFLSDHNLFGTVSRERIVFNDGHVIKLEGNHDGFVNDLVEYLRLKG